MTTSLKVNEIRAKTILTKSGLPGSDYVINPYNGCTFGCMYCYAAQIANWKHPNQEWGTYLDVKINAPEILQLELLKMEKKFKSKDFGSIFFSSVTDPYLGLENKYQITRKCLIELEEFGYKGSIAVQTKSPLVTRDIGILKKIKKVSIGFTITSFDDKVSKFLEVNAPEVSSRFNALKILNTEGIPTYAFVGPIYPHFLSNTNIIKKLLDKLQEVGVKEVWFEHINLRGQIKTRLYDYLSRYSPELISIFDEANTQEYRIELDKFIIKEMKDRGIKLGFGKVIHHHNLPKKKLLFNI